MGDEDIFGPQLIKVKPGMEFGKAVSDALNKAAEKVFGYSLSSGILSDLNNLASAAFSKEKRMPYEITGLPKAKLQVFSKTFFELLRAEKPLIDGKPTNLLASFQSSMSLKVEGEKLVFTMKAPEAKGPELAPLPSTKGMKDITKVFDIALEAGARAAGMPTAKKDWGDEFSNLTSTFKEYIKAKNEQDLHSGFDWNFPVLLSGKQADSFVKAFNSRIVESGLLAKKEEKSLISAFKEKAGKAPFMRFKAVVKLAALTSAIFKRG